MSEFLPQEIIRVAAPALLAAGLVLGACSSPEAQDTPPVTMTETTILEPGLTVVNEQLPEYPNLYTTISPSRVGVPSFDSSNIIENYQSIDRGGTPERYLPLLTISLRDNELIADDTSPLGMDEDTIDWFGERVATHAPLLRAALQSGRMDSIVIALDDDQYDESGRPRETGFVSGYFDADTKSTVFEISTHATILDAGVMDQYLVHEGIHALFASNQLSYFSEETADPALIETFQAACMNLRSLAVQNINSGMHSTVRDLKTMADNQVDPAMTARYQALHDTVANGSWADVQPTLTTPSDSADKLPACTNPRIGQMAASLASQLGLPATNPDLRNPIDSLAFDGYDEAQSTYDDLMKGKSLYRVFSESTYLYEAPAMGHPHDSFDELVASTMNALISFPEDFALKVKYLSNPAEQQAVIDMVRLTIDQTRETNPDLQGYLSDIEAKFLTAVND